MENQGITTVRDPYDGEKMLGEGGATLARLGDGRGLPLVAGKP